MSCKKQRSRFNTAALLQNLKFCLYEVFYDLFHSFPHQEAEADEFASELSEIVAVNLSIVPLSPSKVIISFS